MLTCKLPLIVIVAAWKLYSERQIGVGEFKYGVTGGYLFTGREGVTWLTFQILGPSPYLGNFEARNFKFSTQIGHEG